MQWLCYRGEEPCVQLCRRAIQSQRDEAVLCAVFQLLRFWQERYGHAAVVSFAHDQSDVHACGHDLMDVLEEHNA